VKGIGRCDLSKDSDVVVVDDVDSVVVVVECGGVLAVVLRRCLFSCFRRSRIVFARLHSGFLGTRPQSEANAIFSEATVTVIGCLRRRVTLLACQRGAYVYVCTQAGGSNRQARGVLSFKRKLGLSCGGK